MSLGPGKPDPAADAFQPWQLFTLAGLIGATLVVFLSRGQTPAAVMFLSLTIFTAAALGVAAWRTLSPFAGTQEASGLQVLGGRTRAGLEREKMLVLRSIKDLEFDRAMGKVSEKDFSEMSTRLRARATRLLRQLDAGAGYREQIEKEIKKRVGEPDKARPTTDSGHVRFTDAVKACASCGTENDGDARFCKSCGTSLESPS